MEHAAHVRDLGGVQLAQALNAGELAASAEPSLGGRGLDAVVYDLDRRELFVPVVLEGAGLVLDAGDHLGHRDAFERVACGGHFCPIVQLRGAAAVSVIVDDGEGLLDSIFRVVRVRLRGGETARILRKRTVAVFDAHRCREAAIGELKAPPFLEGNLFEAAAFVEHIIHVLDAARVEAREVERREAAAG